MHPLVYPDMVHVTASFEQGTRREVSSFCRPMKETASIFVCIYKNTLLGNLAQFTPQDNPAKTNIESIHPSDVDVIPDLSTRMICDKSPL